jgi:cytochrome c5
MLHRTLCRPRRDERKLAVASCAQLSHHSDLPKRFPTMQTKRIFLAASADLVEDRKEVERLIQRKNLDWAGRGVALELVIWEDFLDTAAQARPQEQYTRVSREGDIFVMLFGSRLGAQTRDAFTTVFATPPVKQRPFVYAYFKDVPISMDTGATKADLKFLWQFQEQLEQLGHTYTGYKSADALKLHLAQELEILAANGFAAFAAEDAANEAEPRPTAGGATPAGAAKAAAPEVAVPRRSGAARLWISVALVVAIAAGAYGFMRGARMEEVSDAPVQAAAVMPQPSAPRSGEVEPMPPPAGAEAGGSGGQEVFAMACAVCHDAGVAGAPRMGDAAAWAPRIAQGKAVMYQRVLEGYQGKDGFMPAKGGRTDLSDQAVISAVDHIVANSQ